jgi:Fe-coproporphyrin III synthase
MARRKLYGTVIVTYRCNARCNMCNCYMYPTKASEEITLDEIKKLPEMKFVNITGGEPFIRNDLPEIVAELTKKADRIVISTNGFFTEKILDLCRQFPKIGIRISIEGLENTNDEIRGIREGFKRGYNTLKSLVEMKHPDVGFGMTIQDMNAEDLLPLYKLSDELNMEFATGTLHNSFYFKKMDNKIVNRLRLAQNLEKLINELLKSRSPKKWFRAYFNHGIINYLYGQPRLLPCGMSNDAFFIDPFSDVIPCNGMVEKLVMGNLREQSWDELWHSGKANDVRESVRNCDRDCWMIGSASPAMHRYIWLPAIWIIKHKLLKGGKYSLDENAFIEQPLNIP